MIRLRALWIVLTARNISISSGVRYTGTPKRVEIPAGDVAIATDFVWESDVPHGT